MSRLKTDTVTLSGGDQYTVQAASYYRVLQHKKAAAALEKSEDEDAQYELMEKFIRPRVLKSESDLSPYWTAEEFQDEVDIPLIQELHQAILKVSGAVGEDPVTAAAEAEAKN